MVKKGIKGSILSLFVLGSAMLAATGCGSSDTAAKPDQQGAEKQGKVTLKVANWRGDRADVYKDLLDKYKKDHPNVEVVYETKPSDQYFSYVTTKMQAGDAPDLFTSHGTKTIYLKQFVSAGAALPLDGLLDTSFYPKDLVDRGYIDGKQYMSPGAFYDIFPVFYNKGIFDKYHLSEPKTFDDFVKICDTLLQNGVQPFVLPAKTDYDTVFFFTALNHAINNQWVKEFNAGKAKINDPRFIKVLDTFGDFIKKGYFGKDYKALDENGAVLAFTSGQAGMVILNSNQVKAVTSNPDVKVSAFDMPTPDGKSSFAASHDTTSGYSISSKTKYKNESIELLKYLNSKEAVQELASNGVNVPAVPGITSNNPVIQKIAKSDVVDPSWHDSVSPIAKDGYNGWEETKKTIQEFVFAQKTSQQVVDYLESIVDYSKRK